MTAGSHGVIPERTRSEREGQVPILGEVVDDQARDQRNQDQDGHEREGDPSVVGVADP